MAPGVSRKCQITTMLVTLMISTTLFLIVMVKITNSSYYLTKYGSGLAPVRAFNFDSLSATDNTTGVPKILHQIWSSDVIPNEFVENVKGLVKLNPPPEWSYWFWSLAKGRGLIQQKYPKLLPLFDGVENIMKADILRICIIHQYGGVYFDLDTVGVKPLQPFDCSLVTEPPEHTISKDSVVHVDSIINAALFCKAGHPFYDEVLMILEQTNPSCKQPVQCVGPHVLSHVYYEMKRTNSYGSIPRLENYYTSYFRMSMTRLSRQQRQNNVLYTII